MESHFATGLLVATETMEVPLPRLCSKPQGGDDTIAHTLWTYRLVIRMFGLAERYSNTNEDHYLIQLLFLDDQYEGGEALTTHGAKYPLLFFYGTEIKRRDRFDPTPSPVAEKIEISNCESWGGEVRQLLDVVRPQAHSLTRDDWNTWDHLTAFSGTYRVHGKDGYGKSKPIRNVSRQTMMFHGYALANLREEVHRAELANKAHTWLTRPHDLRYTTEVLSRMHAAYDRYVCLIASSF